MKSFHSGKQPRKLKKHNVFPKSCIVISFVLLWTNCLRRNILFGLPVLEHRTQSKVSKQIF